MVSNPEFLREGAAIEDFKRPDRIVIGTTDPHAMAVMREIYRPLHLNQGPLLFVGRRTSELIKYAANAFLAVKITFINEMADLCEAVGADVQDVARGIGLDNRIGSKFLHAGPATAAPASPRIRWRWSRRRRTLKARAHRRDGRRREREAQGGDGGAHRRALGGDVAGKRVAVLGLAFKPNTDDMRDAPSLTIVPALLAAGAEVSAFDPESMEQARPLLPGVRFADSAYACLHGADALVIATEWDEFRALDMRRVRQSLRTPVLVDLRNVYRPADMKALGFAYTGIGRGAD